MPFGTGGGGIHDDGYHTGNAKRNMASGVKGIDAALALDPLLVNADVDAAAAIVDTKISPVPSAALTTHVAANTHANSGTFVADNTNNRAIAHGLGRAPKMVVMGSSLPYVFFMSGACDFCHVSNTGLTSQAVTAADATNFYVSALSANYGVGTPTIRWTAT